MKTPSAEFKLTVTKFRNILKTPDKQRGTLYQMRAVRYDSDLVRVEKYTAGRRKGFVRCIKIHPGSVALRFRVDQPAGSTDHYSPVGIAFVRKGQRKRRTLAARPVGKAFPPHTMALDEVSRALSITAEFPKGRSPDEGQYEFFLFIQHDESGKLGIIDPPLDHDHTDQA